METSDWGDGGYCITGSKVLCRNTSTTCVPNDSTELTCYGVVMVCDNGCSSYACGPCLGLDDVGIPSAGGGSTTGLPCKSGFVWREAYAGDCTCVPPESRSRAWAANAAAAERRALGSDFCVSSYVWREATPSDLVCLLPGTRTETAAENQLAASRTVTPLQVINATCKQGYVWREAIKKDVVWVTPQSREQAWADNAAAASRRVAGSDTCISGYVWREVIRTDHVCVTPEIRESTRTDTALAALQVAN